jgi:HlyD family secretion protein
MWFKKIYMNPTPSPNPENLRPAQPNEFLPPVGGWAIFGGIAMLGIFAGSIALAAILKYPTTVKAPAVIRPTGELRIVQAPVTGKVNRIEVKLYQIVQQGDAIAYLDDSRLQTQKLQLQGNIQQTQAQLDQINAQIQTVQRQITAEKQAIERRVAAAEAELRLNQRQHQQQQMTTQAEVREAEASVKLAKEELARYQGLADSGAVARLQISQKEAALAASVARLQRTQALLNPSVASVEIARERIAQEKATGAATLATLDKEREALTQQKVRVDQELNRDRQELQQIDTDLANTIVRAPATGTIQQLNLRNLNQMLQPGDLIAQIAPHNVPLIVKSYVSPPDIAQVEIGQPVKIKVSGCPYPDYGTLAGTVSAISPDAANFPSSTNPNISEPTPPFSNRRYEVNIQFQSPFLGSSAQPCYLQVGMDGNAEIVTRQDTVLLFFLRKARLLIRV